MLFFKRRPGIAVIEMHGTIGTAIREPEYTRLFERVRENRKVGALVVDIDSPGGSATASDILYENLRRVAQRKPVVAYVRGMGASGGYYIACGASQIMASRAALVGSIGVIYLRPILQQLFGKMGVEFSVFKGGRLKDMSGFWRMPTDEESEKFQGLISQMYDLFVSVVSENRNLTDEQTRELATGELYTAAQARELGLIDRTGGADGEGDQAQGDDLQRPGVQDRTGGFDDAIAEAMRLSGARRRIRHYRPKRAFMARLGMPGRAGGSYLSALEGLAGMMGGGVYFIEPGMMGGFLSRDG